MESTFFQYHFVIVITALGIPFLVITGQGVIGDYRNQSEAKANVVYVLHNKYQSASHSPELMTEYTPLFLYLINNQ